MRRTGPPIFNNIPALPLIMAASFVLVFVLGIAIPAFGRFSLQLGAVLPVYGLDQINFYGGPWPYPLHVFLHGDLMHLAFNSIAMLSFGAAAIRPFGQGTRANIGFLLFFFVCSIAGAAFHIITHPGDVTPMLGASTGLSGCLAAAGWAQNGYRGMLGYALPWAGFNLVLALMGAFAPLPIAWAGHIGGLIAGAALYPLFIAVFRSNSR